MSCRRWSVYLKERGRRRLSQGRESNKVLLPLFTTSPLLSAEQIGHSRITFGLFFKTRPGAQPFV